MIDFLLGVPGKLKTVIDHLQTYLSSTRCAKIDNLDTTMSSRAAASSAVSNAYYTNARGALLDMLSAGGIPGTVKSIQTGYIDPTTIGAIGSGEDKAYKDQTISAVVVSKSIVLLQPGWYASGAVPAATTARLTSATNVRISANNTGVNLAGGRWTVIEFY